MRKIVAGILWRDPRVLVCQRRRGGQQELWWEFPGGKVEAGETDAVALARELREELEIEANIGRLLARHRHTYVETGELELAFYLVEAWRGKIVNRVFEQIRWESLGALRTYALLPADVPLLDQLPAELATNW